MVINWFSYLFFSCFLTFLIIYFLIIFSKKKNSRKIKRLGGLALVVSFLLVIFFSGLEFTNQIWAIIFGSLAILVFGIWDDFKDLSWKIQLFFQFGLIFFVVLMGYNIDYISFFSDSTLRLDFWQWNFFGLNFSLLSTVTIFLLYLVIINSMNWVDGVDGLMGSISAVAGVSILMVSLLPQVNQPAIAIISLILLGGILGFLWFNFPRAKIIAGTSGSYFLGFVLASLSIIAGTKIATLLIVLALPIFDAFWVIFDRIKNGKSIFSKDVDKRHFHYQLRKIGWSDQKILLSYFFFVFIVFFLTLFFDNRQYKLLILFLEIILVIVFIYLVNKKIKCKNP